MEGSPLQVRVSDALVPWIPPGQNGGASSGASGRKNVCQLLPGHAWRRLSLAQTSHHELLP